MTLDEIKGHRDFISVENMYFDYVQDDEILKIVLQERVELGSFYTSYNDIFPKLLTVAYANFFEKIVCEFITNCFHVKNEVMANFVSNQALERKYHAMFNWKENNANQFYGLFGASFRETIKQNLQQDVVMKENEKNFMNLGRFRNEIVHKGISTYNLSLSASDVYQSFIKATAFVVFIFDELKRLFH